MQTKFIAGREFVGWTGIDNNYEYAGVKFLKDEYFWYDNYKIVIIRMEYFEGSEEEVETLLTTIKAYGGDYIQKEAAYNKKQEEEELARAIEQAMPKTELDESGYISTETVNEEQQVTKEAPAEYKYGELIQSKTSNEYKSESLGYRFVAPAAFKLFTREDIFLIQGYDPDEVANNYDQLAAEYEQGDYVVDLCGISEGQKYL